MTLADLSQSPFIQTSLEGTKLDDLVQELAISAREQGVKTAAQWSQLVAQEQKRYRVMVDIFDPQMPLAATLSKELESKLPSAFAGHIHAAELSAVASEIMVSILNNRRTDAAAAARQLTDTPWLEQVRDGIMAGDILPATGQEHLLPGKYDEMKQVLLGPDRDKPEPAAHIIFGALGQLAGHEALAATFAKDSLGTQRFIAELQAQCPDENPAALAAFGQRWMKLREDRAALTVDANRPTSSMVQETIAEGERRRVEGKTAMHGASPIIPDPSETAHTTLLGRIGTTLTQWQTRVFKNAVNPAESTQR